MQSNCPSRTLQSVAVRYHPRSHVLSWPDPTARLSSGPVTDLSSQYRLGLSFGMPFFCVAAHSGKQQSLLAGKGVRTFCNVFWALVGTEFSGLRNCAALGLLVFDP